MTGGNVCCFLCKATVFYQKDDKLQLQDHLRSEHEAEDGLEYLIAGCLMNSEERQAIVNVVKDREPNCGVGQSLGLDESTMMVATQENRDEAGEAEEAGSRSDDSSVSLSALVPETTLQETEGEVGEVSSVLSTSARARGECSPPRAQEKIPVEFPCPECSLSFNLKIRLNRHLKNHAKKREMMSTMMSVKAESMSPSKTPTSKTPTSKTISVKVESTSKKSRAPKNHIEPPPGEGVACPDCGKRFRSRGPMLRHFEDLHQPGEYPCRGCGRVFTSKNKVSSHFSRNCKSRMSL